MRPLYFAQLREQGMDRDAELVDFEPYSLLIPRDAEARLVVPGGIGSIPACVHCLSLLRSAERTGQSRSWRTVC